MRRPRRTSGVMSIGAASPIGAMPTARAGRRRRACRAPARTSRSRRAPRRRRPRPSVGELAHAGDRIFVRGVDRVGRAERRAAASLSSLTSMAMTGGAERPRELDDQRARRRRWQPPPRDSPARRSAPRRTAPYAVKAAQPRIAEASNGRSSGQRRTRRSPGSPRTRPARPSSTSQPASRRRGAAGCRRRTASPEAVDREERLAEAVLPAHAGVAGAARHDERADDPLPDGQPVGVGRREPRPVRHDRAGDLVARARTASGSATSPLITWRSVWQTPQAATLTRISPRLAAAARESAPPRAASRRPGAPRPDVVSSFAGRAPSVSPALISLAAHVLGMLLILTMEPTVNVPR